MVRVYAFLNPQLVRVLDLLEIPHMAIHTYVSKGADATFTQYHGGQQGRSTCGRHKFHIPLAYKL